MYNAFLHGDLIESGFSLLNLAKSAVFGNLSMVSDKSLNVGFLNSLLL